MKPKRGEVWWVNFNPSQGSEVKKVRPAVVVSNDVSNKHLDRFQVIPLTSQTKKVYPGECLVNLGDVTGKVMANQLTTVSVVRFDKKYTVLTKNDILAVEQAVIVQLDLTF